MNQNEQLLKEGRFSALLLRLCVPSVVIMAVMVLYNLADVFFIGKLQDPYKIAAVSLAGPVFSILSGLGTLLGSGGCTVISLALGRGDRKTIRRVSAFCFYGSLLVGVVFAAAVLLFLKPLCTLLGADSSTLRDTAAYLRILACFAPVSLFSNVFMNLIRANGSARESMIANLAGTLTNVVLDPVFILLFRWGVEGAALATGLGNGVSAVVLLCCLRKKDSPFSLRLSEARPGWALTGKVFSLGLPMAFSAVLMSVSQVLSHNLLVAHDTVAVAAQSIAGKVGMLISLLVMGICIGIQPAVSYNYAARNRARTAEILKKTCLITVILGTVLSGLCLVFRDAILGAFSRDASVLAIGRVTLLASVLVGPVCGIYQMATTYFQSTGRAGCAAVCSVLNKGLLFIPVLFLLDRQFGMVGIFFTGAVTDLLSLAIAVLLVLRVIRLPEKETV